MDYEDLFDLIFRLKEKIIIGERNSGKTLLNAIVADAKLSVLRELEKEIVIYRKELQANEK